MTKYIFLTLTLLALSSCDILARQNGGACERALVYENKNQVDPRPLVMKAITGRVLFQTGDRAGEVKDVGPVPRACLSLFSEGSHKKIASLTADEEGRFNFGNIPSGHYRLLVRDPYAGLCVANIPLKVSGFHKLKARGRKQLIVHMRASAIDDCSYGEYR